MHRFSPTAVAIVTCCFTGRALAAEPLSIYQPEVKMADIYFHHPGAKPALKYNHDVDIVKFKGKFFAAWNANEATGEDVPGQYNFLSVSDDFEHWSAFVRLFTRDAAAENPVESDNQWQPCFSQPVLGGWTLTGPWPVSACLPGPARASPCSGREKGIKGQRKNELVDYQSDEMHDENTNLR